MAKKESVEKTVRQIRYRARSPWLRSLGITSNYRHRFRQT
jgi:hypothetical protein